MLKLHKSAIIKIISFNQQTFKSLLNIRLINANAVNRDRDIRNDGRGLNAFRHFLPINRRSGFRLINRIT